MASARLNVASQFDPKGIDQAQRALKKFADESRTGMDKFQDSMSKASATMGKIGTTMSKTVTLPLLGIATAAVKTATEFETSMTKIQSLVGFSAEAVEEMNVAVLDMAGRTATAPKELADALFFATSAGLDASSALLAVESAAMASAAGLGDAATIVDLTTSAVNAYKESGLDAARATDILTAAVRLGKLEPEQLAGAMGQVLPIASSMGIEFEEVAAAFAAMSRTGTDAGGASSQLKGILAGLLKPTAEAHTALADVGLSAGDLHKSLREDGLLATLELLVDRFDGNASATSAVFGSVEALTGVMSMLGGETEETRRIFDETTDSLGLNAEAFAIASETAEFQFRQTMADLKTTMVDVGNVLLPIVVEIAEKFGDLVSRFTELDEGTQKFIVFFGGFVAIVGPMLIAVGKIATGIKAMSTAFVLLRTAMMAHPIMAAATVITLIATALFAFSSNAKEAKARADDFADSIKSIGRDDSLRMMLTDAIKGNEDLAYVVANSSLSFAELETAIRNGSAGTADFEDRLRDAAEQAGITDANFIFPLIGTVQDLNKTYDDGVKKYDLQMAAMVGTMEHLDALHAVMVESERQAGITGAATEEFAEVVELAAVAFQVSHEMIATASTATMEKVTEAANKGAEGFMRANDDMLADADSFIEGLQEQIVDLENWGENLAIIAQVASAEFVAHLAEMGPAGAVLVADFAENLDKAAEASELWAGRNIAAVDSVAIGVNTALLAIQADMAFMDSMLLDLGQMGKMPVPTGAVPNYSPPPHLPQPQLELMSGGMVPGPPSMPVPILAHGGEYVLSADIVDAIRTGAPSRGLESMAPQSVQSGPTVVIENYTSVERSDDDMLIGMLEFAVRGGRL